MLRNGDLLFSNLPMLLEKHWWCLRGSDQYSTCVPQALIIGKKTKHVTEENA